MDCRVGSDSVSGMMATSRSAAAIDMQPQTKSAALIEQAGY